MEGRIKGGNLEFSCDLILNKSVSFYEFYVVLLNNIYKVL